MNGRRGKKQNRQNGEQRGIDLADDDDDGEHILG